MAASSKRNLNHVIFLGAGASATSGFPIGENLRLRLSCRKHFEKELKSHELLKDVIREVCWQSFNHFSESINLLRYGGFGTIDEFSRLASKSYPHQVQNMKRAMRLIFALHNPEEDFQKSDYYPFIQRLFRDDLYNLKENITVISFNYDCYFDFLLLRAFGERQKLTENGVEIDDYWKNKLTSGFCKESDNVNWAKQVTEFNYFKLHGSICYGEHERGYNDLFLGDANNRLEKFASSTSTPVPPIVFPWELFNKKGFISEDDFIFVKDAKDEAAKNSGRRLFNQFRLMWQSAKEMVYRADKISFVGLSMHPYLEDGFRFLLQENNKTVRLVVANPENESYRTEQSKFHPLSPCGKVASLLNRVAKEMKWIASESEADNGMFDTKGTDGGYEPEMTARYSFRDFIEREMR